MSQITYFEYRSFRNRVMPKIVGIFFLGVGLFTVFVEWPVLFVRYLSVGEVPSNWLFYLILPILCFFGGAIPLNLYPDLGISEEGLYVRCYVVKWLFVPWPDVIGLSTASFTISSKTPMYVIHVRNLPVWQRIGFLTGSMVTPGVAFSSDIQGYDRLVKELKARIEKAQGEVQTE